MSIRRALIEDCCGWNRKLWGDALEFVLDSLGDKFQGSTALEIGASPASSLAPALKYCNINVSCSYFGDENREPTAIGNLRQMVEKYAISEIPIIEQDAFAIKGHYDIIILKSVLGGLARGDDYAAIGTIIKGIMQHLNEGGILVVIDNQSNKFADYFRNRFGAGHNAWTYINKDKLASQLTSLQYTQKGFGYLNFAHIALKGVRLEFINDVIYYVDKLIATLFKTTENAVLVTMIRK